MLTDEFAEKVAALVVEKLNAKKERVRSPRFTRVEKRLIEALKKAQKEYGDNVGEYVWRDVYRDMFKLTNVHVRMDFHRSRDKLLNRGIVKTDGFSFFLG